MILSNILLILWAAVLVADIVVTQKRAKLQKEYTKMLEKQNTVLEKQNKLLRDQNNLLLLAQIKLSSMVEKGAE